MKKLIVLSTIYCLLTTTALAQSVDLLWQGDSYTPPFYQGRTLWSRQSMITLVAVPQGLGNKASLNYKWTKNGTVLGSLGGVGKDNLSFLDSVLNKSQTIKVEILSSDKTVLASASTVVTPTTPILAIYENNPLYGYMFHRETSGIYKLINKEVTFAAFPIFFSTMDRTDNNLGYEWRTNAGGVETGSSVTYRIPDDTTGSSEVRLNISNRDKITQGVGRKFLIEFGQNNAQ